MWTVLGEIEPYRAGPELSCSHCACPIFVLVKQPSLESKRVITRFCSADPLNSLFTLGAKRYKKLSDTELIIFGIGAFQVMIVTKIVPDQLYQASTEGLSVMVFRVL